jgi:hypothetical protein
MPVCEGVLEALTIFLLGKGVDIQTGLWAKRGNDDDLSVANKALP